MSEFLIIACVRRRGSIGRFFLQKFRFNSDQSDPRTGWFVKFHEEWELHYFQSLHVLSNQD
jgi:hypothetical protein